MQQSQNNISANQYSFEALFNYATIGIIVTDKNGTIINFNKQAEKDFGYIKDEVVNKRIEILIPPSFKTKHEHYRQGYYKPPSPREMGHEEICLHKKKMVDGKELITDILSSGDFMGYTYILENIAYKENAEVLEDAEIMTIPKDDFLSLISADTQVTKQFIKLITHNVLEKEESLLNLAYNSLRKKVAYQIISMLDKFKNVPVTQKQIRLSRENLAQASGIATESLIRTLSDFKSEKLIDIQGGTIIILNEEKLRNLPY